MKEGDFQVSSSSVALCGAVDGDSSNRILFTFKVLETVKDNGDKLYCLVVSLGNPLSGQQCEGMSLML